MGQKYLKSDLAMCNPFLAFALHNQEQKKYILLFFPLLHLWQYVYYMCLK